MRAIRSLVTGFLFGVIVLIALAGLFVLGYVLTNYVFTPVCSWYVAALKPAGPIALTLGIAGPVLGVLLLAEWILGQYEYWFG